MMTSKTIRTENFVDSKNDNLIICSYINITPKIQILKLNYFDKTTWERVIFPGERLIFEGQAELKLEIKTSEIVTVFVPCNKLRVL